jgi:UDPglucose 6-dehydrogenase
VRQSDVIFITVGTPPSITGHADLYCVEAVIREVAKHVTSKKLIVEKSTVPVRACDSIRRTMELNGAFPQLFSFASNPEFLREGTAVTDFLYPDRIVIGVEDSFAEENLSQIYAPLWDGSYYRHEDRIPGNGGHAAPFIVTNTKSAELIKHTSNAFLAMKISFMNAGIGYGGSCFPKDLLAFRAVAREAGYDFHLLDSVMRINQDQRHQFGARSATHSGRSGRSASPCSP